MNLEKKILTEIVAIKLSLKAHIQIGANRAHFALV